MTTNGSPRGSGTSAVVVFGALFEAALAPLALFLGWLLSYPPLTGFSWNARDALIGVLATVPMLAMLGVETRWRLGPLRRIRRFFDEEVRPLLAARPWSDLALIATAAGIGEEMLFRGLLQGSLARGIGSVPALVAASALFGLLHPITPGYILIAALMGAYLGGVWLLNGNLLTVMVAHALYDYLALRILLRDPA